MTPIDDISEKVAKELDLNPNLVKYINRMQWKFTHKEIQSSEFNPIQIFYIGKFSKKLDRRSTWIINKIKENKKKGNESNKGDI